MVWVRARMAVWRATRRQWIISTWPVPALGTTVASPACLGVDRVGLATLAPGSSVGPVDLHHDLVVGG